MRNALLSSLFLGSLFFLMICFFYIMLKSKVKSVSLVVIIHSEGDSCHLAHLLLIELLIRFLILFLKQTGMAQCYSGKIHAIYICGHFVLTFFFSSFFLSLVEIASFLSFLVYQRIDCCWVKERQVYMMFSMDQTTLTCFFSFVCCLSFFI
jgi:hypothetical protein